MNYISTRGNAPALGFVDALLAGLAPDGGLYCPEVWPSLSRDDLSGLAGLPYPSLAAKILGLFVGDEIDPTTLLTLCEAAYAAFDHPAVTPLTQLDESRFLLELFHGPTLAFKDVAMRILAQLYDHVLTRQDRRMTIVCATSGDTGGAAVEAFRGLDRVKIVVMFPDGRISGVQRRFITTTGDANVRSVAVAGDFDDCQAILKSLFGDTDFAGAVGLSAVNSINFVRIIAQSVYYFAAACALGAPARPVRFTVPTGNFGDAFAGWVAARLGLPIDHILVATNSNDIVARALQSGAYARGDTVATQSPAMDIQVSSNFERLVFECAGRDAELTARLFAEFAATGRMQIPTQVATAIAQTISGSAVDEARTTTTIRSVHARSGLILDPHTAVAMTAASERRVSPGDPPMVVVSTAHPAKFPEAVSAAIGHAAPEPAAVTERSNLVEHIDKLPADVAAVKAYVRSFASL